MLIAQSKKFSKLVCFGQKVPGKKAMFNLLPSLSLNKYVQLPQLELKEVFHLSNCIIVQQNHN